MEAEVGAPYTISTTVERPLGEVINDVREALGEQGFGILTEIDLSWTLRNKVGAEVPAQIILGACRAELAHEAIEVDPSVATLLPCNVVVRSLDADHTVVEAFDPDIILRLNEGTALQAITRDGSDRLRAALESLPGQTRRSPDEG